MSLPRVAGITASAAASARVRSWLRRVLRFLDDFRRALRSEAVRLGTVSLHFRLSFSAVAISALVSVAMAWVISDLSVTGASLRSQVTWVVTGGSSFAYLPVVLAAAGGIIGALAVGTEYEHRTILTTLAAFPRRLPIYCAKLVAASVWSIATVVVTLFLGVVCVETLTPYRWGTWAIPTSLALVAYVWSFTAAGVGLAALLQSQRAAIWTLLIWAFCVEPAVVGLTSALGYWGFGDIAVVVNFLPESSGRRAIQEPFGAYNYPGVWEGTERAECMALLLVVALVLAAIGGCRFSRASSRGT